MSSRWFHHTVDGKAADVTRLAQLATCIFGHFTSMQVRGGCVPGLHLHWQMINGNLGPATLPNRVQTNTLSNTAGTSTVSKLGWPVTRTP
jgi:hypothetical protein